MKLYCKAADVRIKKKSWASILWFPFLICPLSGTFEAKVFFFLLGSIFSTLSLPSFKLALFDL